MDDLGSRGRTQRALSRKRAFRQPISGVSGSHSGKRAEGKSNDREDKPLFELRPIPKDVQDTLEKTRRGRKVLLRFQEPEKRRRTSIYLDEVYKEIEYRAFKTLMKTGGSWQPSIQMRPGITTAIPASANPSVRRFVLHFANNIRRALCPPKGGKSSISPASAATISGLATWIANDFGVHIPAAVALATAVSMLLATGLKGAFCDMTAEELAVALNKMKGKPSDKTWIDSQGAYHIYKAAKEMGASWEKAEKKK